MLNNTKGATRRKPIVEKSESPKFHKAKGARQFQAARFSKYERPQKIAIA
jgi:hypothetical protein